MFEILKASLKWQRVRADEIQFRKLDTEIYILMWFAVLYILCGYILGLVIVHFPLPILGATQFNQDVWYSIVFKILLLLVIPYLLYFIWWKYELKDLLLGIKATKKNVIATLVMVCIGFFLNAGHLEKIQQSLSLFSDARARLTLGIIMPLLTAAIPEEFYFRGYLQTRLEKKWNRLTAILVSTFLFTAWHLPSRYLLSKGVEGQAGDWLEVIVHTGIPVFIVGTFFALHWSRYRNIVLLVLTHWAIDILPSVSSYFKIRF
jgi:uncharacterized protein